MRKTTALIAAIALLAGLTACAGGSGIDGCSPVVSSGDASSAITAKGQFGKAPTVTFPTPLYTKTTEKTQLLAGHGQPIQAGQPVTLDVTVLNGTTGAVIGKSSYASGGGSIVTTGKSTIPALTQALRCATAGSRVAIVGTAKDSHSGKADATNGIGANDSFVYVVDVRKSFLAKANGADQVPQNGLPAVVTTADGTPGITIPAGSAPTSTQISVLKQGSGARVGGKSIIVAQFTGVGWDNRTVFSSTWSKHQATVLEIGGQSVSNGLSKALTGQRVGSQVLVVLPPKSDVVADGTGNAPADTTAVYVVDILGILG